MDQYLETVLREAVAKEASDIHLKVGVPPNIRIHGSLVPFSDSRLTADDMNRIVDSLLDSEQREKSRGRGEIDVAQTIPGVARFRCNVFKQRGSFEIVMRVVPYAIPTVDSLMLPPILKHIALEARGLVLVTGITGSGKSSTVAAMVQQVNEGVPVHIVTIEDPIEFVYRDAKASISQREVGIDTETFHHALKYVLRQDPDVIVLGEMRDQETAATAVTAAETGHLVFSTLHTADAVQTIDRLIDLFPAAVQTQIRHQVASSLKAIVSMRLIAKADGKGRVPAVEVLINTPAIKSLIEEGKLNEIKPLIVEGAAQYGMQTFDQSLLKLFKQNLITKEAALEEATSPAELELGMRGISVGTMSAQSFMKTDSFYKSKSKEYYERARRLFEQDLHEDALREIRRALVDDPEDETCKALLAKIEEKMAKETSKSKVEPFIKRGLELVAQDKIEEGIAVFRQALEQDPNNEKLLSMIKAADEKGQRVRGIRPLLEKAAAHQAQSQFAEARQVLTEVLEKDPGNSEALDRFTEILAAQARQQSATETESLLAKGEQAHGEKRWFDSIAFHNLVREIQPDHAKATQRVGEAGAQLKAMGVPGLAAAGAVPWAGAVQQGFERGLTLFLGAQTLACLNEWKQAAARAPQANDMLNAYLLKVAELHGSHVTYHVGRANELIAQNDMGKAMAQLRHALQVDPQAADARSLYEKEKPVADATVKQYLQDAETWEKQDRFRAAVFCWERAYEVDPGRDGLKQKVAEGRARLAKLKELNAALDRRG